MVLGGGLGGKGAEVRCQEPQILSPGVREGHCHVAILYCSA